MARAQGISNALDPLRSVVQSLADARAGEVPSGPARRRLVREARSAGPAVLPTLLRSLASPLEVESSWAYFLLGRIGGGRVIQRLSELLEDSHASDDVKARALGLLSDLGAPIPADVSLLDPDGLLQKSVRDLLGSVSSPSDLREATQLVLEQVPEEELPAFAAELLLHGGAEAQPLIAALSTTSALLAETRAALSALVARGASTPEEREAHEALERGLSYLEAGKPKAALLRLTRFATKHPDHAEGQSALGVCLLNLDRSSEALPHLERAATLEPDEALHRWNLAAAAKRASRLGGAYLALRDYLRLAKSDTDDGADDRRSEARSFTRAYERMLREAHPGVSLADFVRGEELFARAFAALSEGRVDAAVEGFERVLERMPEHYPSWGNLGVARLRLGQEAEARACLRRALELKPDYGLALKNLELVTEG